MTTSFNRDALLPDTLRRLVEILTHFGRINTVQERQTFLELSGLQSLEPHLHLTEATHQFATELIRESQRVGSFTGGGEPAFYQLLGYLQKEVSGQPEAHEFLSGLRRSTTPPVTRADTLQRPSLDFTGRTAEIERLSKALRQGRPVMISGMGGIGKSDLARKVAESLRAEFPDAALQVELQPDNKPVTAAEVVGTLILALQPAIKLPDALAERVALLRPLMQAQKGILLLDNAKSRAQIQPLVGLWRGWAVLITSRKEFDVSEAETEELNPLKERESEKLLKLHLVRKKRKESAVNLKMIAQACHYHPLALVIAAAFLGINKSWTVKDYLERIKERILDGFIPKTDEYDNLAAVLGISIEELQCDDSTVCERWHLLALMPDTFDAELAGALLGQLHEGNYPRVTPLDDPTTKATLDALVRLNLLETILPSTENEVTRYRLHDFLTDYALHHSPHRPAQAAQDWAVRCHALTVLRQGSDLDKLYLAGKPIEALVQFDALWNHLNGAWHRLNQAEDATAHFVVEKFGNWMAYLLNLRLSPRTLIPYQEGALRAARTRNDRSNEAVHFGNLGLAYADLGEVRTAIRYHEQAMVIAREIGDRRGEGNRLGNLGLAYADLGEVRTAIGYFEQALVIAHEIGDRRGAGNQTGNLGIAYATLGEVRTAIVYFEQALVIAHEIGDRRGAGNQTGNLGIAYATLGEVRTAIVYFEQALVIAREIGDKRGEGAGLGNLGIAYTNLGEVRTAIGYYEQALVIRRAIGDKRGEGNDCWNLALAYEQEGERERAIGYARAALALYEATEDPWRERVRTQLREWG